jgi:3-oxoacyl-[acyl-carrier protein] reductase
LVRQLARAGADVAVHYHRNADQAKRLVEEVRALGRQACAVQAELSDLASVMAMRDHIAQAIGDPAIVVANAVSQIFPWKPVVDEDTDDYLNQFQSTVMQAVCLAKAFVPAMQKAGYGRIVGMSTECVMQNRATQSAYVSGKRGMDGVWRSLCREIGADGITVNQVAPGWTRSDDPSVVDDDAAYLTNVPLGRRGTSTEVANAVVFLASRQASFVTGAWLPVCGGYVLPAI